MSTPVADQPTRDGADDGPRRGDRPTGAVPPVPGGEPGAPGTEGPAAPLTVAELLARSGTGVRRRRADRREAGEATGRQQSVDDAGTPLWQPGAARDDGPVRPGRPTLSDEHGPRGTWRDRPQPSAVPSPPVLPTGWQPAMPGPASDPEPAPPAEEPAVRPVRPPVAPPGSRAPA
ncbi:hypothetical protein IN07_04105, partial [Modestobacter caceresii]